MNIIEATKKAIKQNKGIGNGEQHIYPMDFRYAYFIVSDDGVITDKRWAPKADDILNDNWRVIE